MQYLIVMLGYSGEVRYDRIFERTSRPPQIFLGNTGKTANTVDNQPRHRFGGFGPDDQHSLAHCFAVTPDTQEYAQIDDGQDLAA